MFTLNVVVTQVSMKTTPKSISLNLSNNIPNITLPELDHDMLLLEDLEEMDKNMPYRFGSPVDVNLNLDNSGMWKK